MGNGRGGETQRWVQPRTHHSIWMADTGCTAWNRRSSDAVHSDRPTYLRRDQRGVGAGVRVGEGGGVLRVTDDSSPTPHPPPHTHMHGRCAHRHPCPNNCHSTHLIFPSAISSFRVAAT
jgi:hypothetical protein